MLFSRADIKGRTLVAKQYHKVRPTLSVAQSITPSPLNDACSPLNCTQKPAAPPTAHRLCKLRPLVLALLPEMRNSPPQRKLGNGV